MKSYSNMDDLLAHAPITPLFFKLALPAITAQIVNVLYNVVDRIYISRIKDVGDLALTGVGLCMPLITIISSFACLVSLGGAPRASIMIGQGNKDTAQKVLGNCFSLLIFVAVLLTIFFSLFSKPLLLSFGASENTIVYAMDYIQIYVMGTIFVQLTIGLNAFISAQGLTKISMATILIGAIVNIILDPIFIFGLGLGVRGAGLATVIAQACSSLWVIRFLKSEKSELRLQKENMKLDAKIITPCLLLGLAPFIMQFTEAIMNICFNSSLLKYGGDIAVGSMTILSNLVMFCFMPLSGMAQGAQPITGYNFGIRNAKRVKESVRILVLVSVTYSMSLFLIVRFFPEAVIGIFAGDNPELLEHTVWASKRFMLCVGLLGLQLSCQQSFIALGNAKTSLFLAIFRKMILLIPLIYILPIFLEDKVEAVFLAQPTADIIAVSTTAFLFFTQFKSVLKDLEQSPSIPSETIEQEVPSENIH